MLVEGEGECVAQDGAAAAPPPNRRGGRAILGDALALALNQHARHNPRGASERAPAESEDLLGELEEEMLVRRAVALTSSLRLEAPVFVPVLHCAAMRIVVARPGP